MKQLLLILLCLCLISCSPSMETKGAKVAVLRDNNLKDDAGRHVSIDIYEKDLAFDPGQLVKWDNSVYHRSLSVFLSLLAADAYDNVVVDMTGSTDAKDNTALYLALGMTNIVEKDIEGVTHVIFAQDSHADTKNEYSIVFVTLQGTNGTHAQWASNFDIGADTEAFSALVPEDPYWKNKENHRGFDIAANIVMEHLEEYLEHIQTPQEKTILVFTGHSRGAGIAALLGSHYETHSDYKTFTYTFASPTVTQDKESSAAIKTVFNIINSDDYIPVLPLESWGFVQMGKTKRMSVSKELSSEWTEAMGKRFYVSAGASSANAPGGILSKLGASREDVYEFGVEPRNTYTLSLKGPNGTMLDPEEELQALETYGLGKYADLRLSDDGTKLEGVITTAFIMNFLVDLIAPDEAVKALGTTEFLTKYSDGFSRDYHRFANTFAVAGYTGGFANSHAPSTYFLMARKLK